jgi:hypothetical protein
MLSSARPSSSQVCGWKIIRARRIALPARDERALENSLLKDVILLCSVREDFDEAGL